MCTPLLDLCARLYVRTVYVVHACLCVVSVLVSQLVWAQTLLGLTLLVKCSYLPAQEEKASKPSDKDGKLDSKVTNCNLQLLA